MVVSKTQSELVNNDELAAFVTSTLRAITRGIEEADGQVRKQKMSGYATFSMPNKVSFDIAVTAKRGDEVGGGLKVQVFSIGAKASSEDQTISRISFEVPWHFTSTTTGETLRMLGKSLA